MSDTLASLCEMVRLITNEQDRRHEEMTKKFQHLEKEIGDIKARLDPCTLPRAAAAAACRVHLKSDDAGVNESIMSGSFVWMAGSDPDTPAVGIVTAAHGFRRFTGRKFTIHVTPLSTPHSTFEVFGEVLFARDRRDVVMVRINHYWHPDVDLNEYAQKNALALATSNPELGTALCVCFDRTAKMVECLNCAVTGIYHNLTGVHYYYDLKTSFPGVKGTSGAAMVGFDQDGRPCVYAVHNGFHQDVPDSRETGLHTTVGDSLSIVVARLYDNITRRGKLDAAAERSVAYDVAMLAHAAGSKASSVRFLLPMTDQDPCLGSQPELDAELDAALCDCSDHGYPGPSGPGVPSSVVSSEGRESCGGAFAGSEEAAGNFQS